MALIHPSIRRLTIHVFKEVCLKCQLAKCEQISCKTSSGRGKGYIRWIGTLVAMDDGNI